MTPGGVATCTCTTVTPVGELVRGFVGCPCDPPVLAGVADERGVTTTAFGARTEDFS
jgi:hypothetical protein